MMIGKIKFIKHNASPFSLKGENQEISAPICDHFNIFEMKETKENKKRKIEISEKEIAVIRHLIWEKQENRVEWEYTEF